MNEYVLHCNIIDYLNYQYGNNKDLWFTSIEVSTMTNHIAKQMQLKRKGCKKGTPDILLVYKGCPFFIEVKLPGKNPDKDQKRVHLDIKLAGSEVYVCRSIDDVKEVMEGICKK